MEQFIPDTAVVHLCGRGLEAMCDPAFNIHADMRLHTEAPVVTLLFRSHLRVSYSGLVLVRRWRMDNRRIHQRARTQGDILVDRMRIHLGSDRPGHPSVRSRQTGAGFTVIKRLFGHRLAQGVPVR